MVKYDSAEEAAFQDDIQYKSNVGNFLCSVYFADAGVPAGVFDIEVVSFEPLHIYHVLLMVVPGYGP